MDALLEVVEVGLVGDLASGALGARVRLVELRLLWTDRASNLPAVTDTAASASTLLELRWWPCCWCWCELGGFFVKRRRDKEEVVVVVGGIVGVVAVAVIVALGQVEAADAAAGCGRLG